MGRTLGGPTLNGLLLENAEHVGFLHDQAVLAIEDDLGARPFAEQDAIADLDVERDQLAGLVAGSRTDGQHLAFLRLLLGGVGDDDASLGRLLRLDAAHDQAVVKRIDAEEKSKGGIIIPDTAKEKPSQGQVIAVGPGGRDESGKVITPDVKAGDKVLFGKWSGTEVVLDGEDLLIMKESDIMGIVG